MKKRKNRPSGLKYNVVATERNRPFNLKYKIEYIKCFRCEKMKNKNTTLLLKWGRSFFVICKPCNNKYRLMPNRIK